MKGFDFWKFAVAKDDFFLSAVEFLASARNLWGLRNFRWRKIGERIVDANRVRGGDVVIVLNGPSIKEQPLERLKGKDLIFVNQGFRLPAYKELCPKYHVFIDTKMVRGVWDIKWLNEIKAMVPNIIFVMPASWARLPMLKPYVNSDFRIIWTENPVSGVRGLGVSGECFNLAKRLGYRRIFFTGFEATSFPLSLLKQASHFYGNDSDEETMDASDFMKGYYMNARQMRELILCARRFKKSGCEVINITNGGLLEMFERRRFDDVFKE